MTGPKANSEFCFPGNIEFQGKQNLLFPKGPIIKSDWLFSKTKQKEILKNALRFQRQNQVIFSCTL